MPHLLQHKQIDKTAWDACIEASEQGQVYALSWYLDIVSQGWQAVVEQEEGRYIVVMPLPVRCKYGLAYLQQPLFCQQLGIYSIGELVQEQVNGFLALVQKSFRYTSGYTFNTANSFKQLHAALGGSFRTVYTHYLSLNQPYAAIWKGYTRDRKYNLNKARREKVNIVQSKDIEPLINLFKHHIAHKIYGGVAEEAYAMLRRLFKALVEKGIGELLYIASEDGSVIAGGLFVYYRGHIIYIFNAADAKGRQSNGRTLILDNVIQRNSATPQVLDFESPMIESISGFYQSFGSVPVPLYEWRYNSLPAHIRLLKQLRQKILLNLLNKL